MTARAPARRTTGLLVLLWFRVDLPRERCLEHWTGTHAGLVARTPGLRDYRQHELDPTGDGLWGPVPGVRTALPGERVDAVAEVTTRAVPHPLAAHHSRPVHRDEAHLFRRTVLNTTPPFGGRRFPGADGGAATAVVLLRAREHVSTSATGALVHETLGPALHRRPGVTAVRTQSFVPYRPHRWDTPGVGHDYPPDRRFDAVVVVEGRDPDAVAAALRSPALAATADRQRELFAAVHAYPVRATRTCVRDGRPVGSAAPSR